MMGCYTCRDIGIFCYHKPVEGLDKKIHMVLTPQRCYCPTGQKFTEFDHAIQMRMMEYVNGKIKNQGA